MDNSLSDGMGRPVVAVSAGCVAERVLAAGPLRVAAAFERSFYVEDRDGRLACFLREGAEPGPLHVVCAGWRAPRRCGVAAGVALRRTGPLLEAEGLRIDLERSRPWRPPAFPRFDREACAAGRGRLLSLTGELAPPDSLAAGRPLDDAGGGGDPMAAALRREIRAGLAALSSWIANPDGRVPDGVFSLLGLGPGLTPSGDDVVAGALLTLHALDRRELAARLGGALLARPRAATNRISWAHLSAAAEGCGALVFHEILNDVLGGGTALRPLLERAGRVGHTSGWDVVLGMTTTLGCGI